MSKNASSQPEQKDDTVYKIVLITKNGYKYRSSILGEGHELRHVPLKIAVSIQDDDKAGRIVGTDSEPPEDVKKSMVS